VLLQVKNGRERSSALRGFREMERQVGSVRGTRWTVGLGAGHMVATQARRCHGQASRCTVAVKSSGLAGGRTEHAGFGGLPTKPSEDGFLVWASKPSPRAQHDGDGIRACRENFEAEDTRRDRMACVGRTRGATKAWPSDGKAHKHYLNAPAWVVSPVVKLGVVESFTSPAGPDI
jgi:hypothetical protein